MGLFTGFQFLEDLEFRATEIWKVRAKTFAQNGLAQSMATQKKSFSSLSDEKLLTIPI